MEEFGASLPYSTTNINGNMSIRPFRVLKPDDQVVVALVLSFLIVFMGFYFWRQAVIHNGLVDFADMSHQEVLYQVEINSAPWQEFANLPGIGENLAQEIVRHRNHHGAFSEIGQLEEVSGIGPRKLQAMQPYIALSKTQ